GKWGWGNSRKGSGNGRGIEVTGDAATLKGNRAEGKGFPGGASDGVGLGILVGGFTTAPLGTNVVRGNDDAAECQPASLCLLSSKAKPGLKISSCGQSVTAN